MAGRIRFVEGCVIWSAGGAAWALYRMGVPGPLGEASSPPPPPDDHHRRMEAILGLPGQAMLASFHAPGHAPDDSGRHGAGAAERLRFLAAELPAPSGRPARSPLGEVMRIAGAGITGAFGIPPGAPGAREVSACSRRSEELGARLRRCLWLRPAAPSEVDSIDGRWWAPGAGEIQESRRYGHLRLELESGLAYRTLLAVSRVPRGFPVRSGQWARVAEEAPFPVDWCLRTRPLPGSPVVPEEMAIAVLFSLRAENLIELDERITHLRRACAGEGLRVDRPRNRQPALHAAMWPPGPCGPALNPYLQLMALQDLDSVPARRAALERIVPVSTPSPGSLLRIRRGPRRGMQVALERRIVIGGDGADLDLGDPAVPGRHAAVIPMDEGAILRNLTASGRTRVRDRELRGETVLEPGQSFVAGASELILLRYGPPAPPAEDTEDIGGPGGRASRELAIGSEEQAERYNVRIEAGGEATCEQVTRSIAEYLGLDPRAGYCAYLRREGRYLPGTEPWRHCGVLRGDILEIGALAEGSQVVPQDRLARSLTARADPDPAPARTVISRPPRTTPALSPLRVHLPPAPPDLHLRGAGTLWRAVAASGALATSFAVALALPGFRWVALAGGSTAILGVLAGFMAERSRRRFQRREFLARLHELDRALADTVTRQSADLERAGPAVATLARWGAQRDDRLWERRPADPDFLVLRLGVGRRPSLIDIAGRPPDEHAPLAPEVAAVLGRHDRIPRAPITLAGPGAPLVGIAGPQRVAGGLARSLLIQAAALHAPKELRIALIAASRAWSWARWLPHVMSETGAALISIDAEGADLLAAELGRRMGQGDASGPALLILVDPETGRRPSVSALSDTAAGSDRGRGQVIFLAGSRHGLPSACTTIIEVGDRDATMIGAGTAGDPVRFSAETLPADEALDAARSLAPLREAGAGDGRRSRNTRLLEILGLEGPETIPVEELWYGRR